MFPKNAINSDRNMIPMMWSGGITKSTNGIINRAGAPNNTIKS